MVVVRRAAFLLLVAAPLARAATGLSGWRSGILTNYGGPFDGKNPNEPSWGTSVVSLFFVRFHRAPRFSASRSMARPASTAAARKPLKKKKMKRSVHAAGAGAPLLPPRPGLRARRESDPPRSSSAAFASFKE